MSSVAKSVGELICYYRKRDDRTQGLLAKWLDCSVPRICRIESGKASPRPQDIEILLQPGHLHVSDEERAQLWLTFQNDIINQPPKISHPSEKRFENEPDDLDPFVIYKPISYPKQFFGRTKELKPIFTAWEKFNMQDFAVIGKRRSGKTSLLNYIKTIPFAPINTLRSEQRNDWLSSPERYHWIDVDFQNPIMCEQEGLFRYISDCLHISIPSPCTLSQFTERVKIPLGAPTVILMDEISVAFSSAGIEEMFWTSLRSLACDPRLKLALIVASDRPISELMHSYHGSSPLLNIFRTLDLGPFTEMEARELISCSPLPFDVDDVAWIIEKSGCWPAFVQILCKIRLEALENHESDEAWKHTGLHQMENHPHLLDNEEMP